MGLHAESEHVVEFGSEASGRVPVRLAVPLARDSVLISTDRVANRRVRESGAGVLVPRTMTPAAPAADCDYVRTGAASVRPAWGHGIGSGPLGGGGVHH
jgi:hypothetical protein